MGAARKTGGVMITYLGFFWRGDRCGEVGGRF